MYILLFISLWAFSTAAFAADCINHYSEQSLLAAIDNGKAIHTPFKFGYLVDGMHEPEMKYKTLDVSALEQITSRVQRSYRYALKRGAEKKRSGNDRVKNLVFRGPNSGYHVTFTFQNINGCWKLTSLIDGST